MGKLYDEYSARIQTLSQSEKYTLCAIDTDITKYADMNITVLAEKIGVSTTTIIRLAKKLGLRGFSELKFVLKKFQNEQIKTGCGESLRIAITRLLSPESSQNYQVIAQKIKHATRVCIFACGLSRAVGEYFAQLLTQSGVNVAGAYDSHMIDLIAGTTGCADFCIFISGSGNTATLARAIERLSARNVATAAITGDGSSAVAQSAQYAISAAIDKTTVNGYDATPRSALMLVVDLIYTEMANS